MLIILGIISTIFAVFMIRTVYRIFGIVYFTVFFLIAVSFVATSYVDNEPLSLLRYISYVPLAYPLLLVYIVKTKAKYHQQEIESIGMEIVNAKDAPASDQVTRRM